MDGTNTNEAMQSGGFSAIFFISNTSKSKLNRCAEISVYKVYLKIGLLVIKVYDLSVLKKPMTGPILSDMKNGNSVDKTHINITIL